MITWKKHKIITLPTFTKSLLQRIGESTWFECNKDNLIDNRYTWQHLHVLSDDPLKIGDKIYECLDNGNPLSIDTCTEDHLIRIAHGIDTQCYKIIASTDKSLDLPTMPDSFLKEYCERGGMDEVMVGYLESGHLAGEFDEISIKPVNKPWTRDDMESLIDFTRGLAYMDGTKAQHEFSANDILNKWIEQNL